MKVFVNDILVTDRVAATERQQNYRQPRMDGVQFPKKKNAILEVLTRACCFNEILKRFRGFDHRDRSSFQSKSVFTEMIYFLIP